MSVDRPWPRIGKMVICESAGGNELHQLIQYLDEQVLDTNFFEFRDYWYWFLEDYLSDENKERFLKRFEVDNLNHIDPSAYEVLPLPTKKIFTDWVEEKGGFRMAEHEDPADCPGWFYTQLIDHSPKPSNTWLVHFTDNPDAICRQGLIYGAPDHTRLAVTFGGDIFGNVRRSTSREAGFNFAYTLDEDIEHRANKAVAGKYYGKHAVLFQAPCVRIKHLTDNENQAIFWGPSASSKITPLMHTSHGWVSPHTTEGQQKITDLINLVISGI